MLRYIKLFALLVLCLVLAGCDLPGKEYTVTWHLGNGQGSQAFFLEKGSALSYEGTLSEPGQTFAGWYLDAICTQPLPEDFRLTQDTQVYAKWEPIIYKRTFYVDGQVYADLSLTYDQTATADDPVKDGWYFTGWSTSPTEAIAYDLTQPCREDITLYAMWETRPFTVTYEPGFEVFVSKDALFEAFFSDFYEFMVVEAPQRLARYGMDSREEFVAFCRDWNGGGSHSFYGLGNAFCWEFVTTDVGGTVEEQPTNTFIGYCYHNNRYRDVIDHLIKFFAYWRIDEGFAHPEDPDDNGDDFFAHPMSSLVDTAKFFYFTSENLNDVYPWFKSQRVKDALDNIPGVVGDIFVTEGISNEPIVLPVLQREGYEFLGWYDSAEAGATPLTQVNTDITVYAQWRKLP